MERRKLTKENIDKVRDIDGFPIGTDEDIIALSDAPYYTACPNPFIEDFIKEYGTPYDEEKDEYHCEPYATDVSIGKNDPTYLAHSYHTKVPYKAIMRYILHYTEPGDIVLDGFAGTGMTGLAALMCGKPDVDTKLTLEKALSNVKWGKRYAILSDLSPAATFIAENYNIPANKKTFKDEAIKIIEKTKSECTWLYKTLHTQANEQVTLYEGNKTYGTINYVIWSDVYICPNCGKEIIFWNQAVDSETKKVKEVFSCPNCSFNTKKSECSRAKEIVCNEHDDEVKTVSKQVIVQICYTYNGQRYIKCPDEEDFELIKRISDYKIESWFPCDLIPAGDNTNQPIQSHGVKYVYDFLYKRALIVISTLRKHCPSTKYYWLITSILEGSSKLNRERPNGLPSKLNGTLYIASMVREINVIDFFERKIDRYIAANLVEDSNIISTGSCTDLSIVPNDCVDYIFTDPPFGSNINYSELSFAWEAWLSVKTNNCKEAIINKTQKKGLIEYQELMQQSFNEYFRVLKPNRWITVEFHNSKNSVWNAIQEALLKAGFVIADVRTLDKKQGSFKQVTTSTAVKQDLIITAYKPKSHFTRKMIAAAGTDESAWAFVSGHLANLPVVVDADHNGKIDILSERQAFLLFDRMVAYHIMQGIPVPMNASEFYAGLKEHFIERDSMYFLSDQVNEYDVARIKMDVEDIQMELFVTNEKSAIAWLYKQLEKPQTYADIQPKFMQEAKPTDKHEIIPELSVLLEENFIQNDEGKWYIPDVTKEADVNKLREKRLWKEFEGYMNSKGKLKLFRSEAIRVGFSKLWKENNYQAIVDIAERLPEKIVQEDANILMYYDISLSRI